VSERVLIMAGGTGGHVFPALAVAEALRARGLEIVWIGTRLGLEARVVPAAGIRLEWIEHRRAARQGPGTRLLAPLRVGLAVLQALRIVLRVKPAVVLGMGGYAAGPGGLAAWLARRPLVIHEQNAIAGLTNRMAGEARPACSPRSRARSRSASMPRWWATRCALPSRRCRPPTSAWPAARARCGCWCSAAARARWR
jgi:hypothetical protein